jgi:hypothetical protein
MVRSRESPLNPTESRFAQRLNESFATHSEGKAELSHTCLTIAIYEYASQSSVATRHQLGRESDQTRASGSLSVEMGLRALGRGLTSAPNRP